MKIAPDALSQPPCSLHSLGGGRIYLSIFGHSFVIGIQYMAPALNQVHRNLVPQDFGEVLAEVLVQHVKQFRRKLYPSWPATTYHER